jgi:CRP-like cAMP-binding protein
MDALSPCALLAGTPASAVAELSPAIERLPAGSVLLDREGNRAEVRLLLDGWACREMTLTDGRRQIIGLMFPNDICSYWTPIGVPWTHEVRALTACRVLRVEAEPLSRLADRIDAVQSRLGERACADTAVLHAWLLNLGQRKARERIAHLFCELNFRLEAAGLCKGHRRPTIPLTQQDLADTVGMTSVHVNRVLQRLKLEGLVDVGKGSVRLLDAAGLAQICEFDPAYLGSQRRAETRLAPIDQTLAGAAL